MTRGQREARSVPTGPLDRKGRFFVAWDHVRELAIDEPTGRPHTPRWMWGRDQRRFDETYAWLERHGMPRGPDDEMRSLWIGRDRSWPVSG